MTKERIFGKTETAPPPYLFRCKPHKAISKRHPKDKNSGANIRGLLRQTAPK